MIHFYIFCFNYENRYGFLLLITLKYYITFDKKEIFIIDLQFLELSI